VIDEFKVIQKEMVVAYSRHYLGIFLEVMRKATKSSFIVTSVLAKIRNKYVPWELW
jgi:hypothetical protein